ncbi:MAG TPA: selenocysteine-specific translation elongation factor [Solirubrobacteraceae bacterium]|nr:selenocysteine-specific translation elongation factor [Solirubrobacteraceae bacterium]
MTPAPGGPLTVGTAGHIDHGKTALVQALTGVNTDRLPEEQSRGITIVLGFAQLRLPSGRLLSLVDVPGHERLVRVMVSGASGIDLFLLVIAADDGVMPQTLEHVRVLQALEVRSGLVAVTKSDLADPGPTLRAAAELLPQAERVACSARSGHGVADVAAALDRVAAGLARREPRRGEAVLHIDRAFTIRGAGTVLTGTLWSGSISRGDRLRLLPSGRTVRVRGVHVHDQPVDVAEAGQRVAVNLTGLELRQVSRGDVLVGEAAPAETTFRVEAELTSYEPLADGERVQVHHGTRHAPARMRRGEGGRWQLRLERALIAAAGDHLVIRRISPAGTVAGGTVVRVARPGPRSSSTERPPSAPAPHREPGLDAAALALEERLRAAGAEPLAEHDLDGERAALRALQAAGRAVRVGRMYAHADAVAWVRSQVERVIQAEGSITLARLRDELGTSRRYAQAFLEHLDAARVTRRRPDDSRVLRGELG